MLLHSVKDIRILATSREALNIPGEVVWRIPSLSVPEASSKKIVDEVQHFEAIKLFTDRAASGKPGFVLNPQNVSPIIGICRRVAGIPLAIEIAATRIKHLGADTILERLEDQFDILSTTSRTVPERQQTLKATIDWSYNLLSEQEQLLFNRLSVFAGDFSLEAIEEACSDEKLNRENIITVISQLVDKSLVVAENQEDGYVRYSWLAPLQQYSLQKLIDSREEEIYRKCHLTYYLKLAEQAYEGQFDSELKWLNKLEQEHDNLIAALNWSFNQAIEEFILLSGYLSWFWWSHSHLNLAEDYLEKALSQDIAKSEGYARAAAGLGKIYAWVRLQNSSRGNFLLNESLILWRQFKNLREEAFVLSEIGYPYFRSGDFETALVYISTESWKSRTC
jgi:non-specific serine/threonine protein kinase